MLDLRFINPKPFHRLLKSFMPNDSMTLRDGVAGLLEQVRQPIG